MSIDTIGVPSTIITDIDQVWFKDINELSLYDIWCDALKLKIHMETNIPNKLG